MTDSTQEPHKIAIVQQPPVFLDRDATIERAVSYVHEAADNGARLVAFPETYIPGYPEWIGLVHYRTEGKLVTQLYQQLLANAVRLDAGDLDPLCEVARSRGVTVVCGIQECDGEFSRSTLYNTAMTIDPSGLIVNRHRKLVPTGVERGLWGMGDGSGLRVVETPVGRIGMLICFENQMPLARYALYAQGIDIYLALTVADGDLWLASMRHIAFEGACWVLNCGTALHTDDVPDDFPVRDRLAEHGWIRSGDSAVISPSGKVVAGALHDAYGILYADCTPDLVAASRRRLDVAGH
ncbi:MAG: carbon-nitrogen hydrolase family protein, partial [Caldilineaceae bacterium]|nr:carbon-nitrogen hydrolase family protein [Caldilineaceae bacterium]